MATAAKVYDDINVGGGSTGSVLARHHGLTASEPDIDEAAVDGAQSAANYVRF